MCNNLSIDSKAILLLTAPLISGGNSKSVKPLTHGEYKRLAQRLRALQRKPRDFFAEDSDNLLQEVDSIIDKYRLQQLLDRSFLLSQAIERWSARAIWVVTRADANYPQKLWNRLKDDRPAVLYCCGNFDLLENKGLAVVGSRQVSEEIVEYSIKIGQQAAQADRAIVSGSAKGVDQAAMNGALKAGGKAVGVLACNLERAVMNREDRNFIKEGRLTLISPFDPVTGFNVGNAMQRNKFIYALSDAALVVNSSFGKGGTWTGAVEQLDKLKYVPIYVRSTGAQSSGLDGLRDKGALPWPNPENNEQFAAVFKSSIQDDDLISQADQKTLQADCNKERSPAGAVFRKCKGCELKDGNQSEQKKLGDLKDETSTSKQSHFKPSEEIYAAAKQVIKKLLVEPKKDTEIAEDLEVSQKQVKTWLKRLVQEGVIIKVSKPVRYVVNESRQLTFSADKEER